MKTVAVGLASELVCSIFTTNFKLKNSLTSWSSGLGIIHFVSSSVVSIVDNSMKHVNCVFTVKKMKINETDVLCF